MSKFVRLFRHLKQAGIVKSNIVKPKPASLEELSIAHKFNYLRDMCENSLDEKVWRRVGLPWSQGLINRTLTAPNGTLLTARAALQKGIACHLAGGTHHAHADFGSGFCMVNDLAYTAKSLLAQGLVNKVLIFDLDVHQGDGTASMLADTPNAFTCSIHCEKNFPFRKYDSDLDVGLAVDLEDKAYLNVIEETFEYLLAHVKPDIVLYDAGVDVWEHDVLGRLNISWRGIQQRDQFVLSSCLKQGIPVATVIGGGYDKDHERLAQRHAIVIETAHQLYQNL